MNLFSELYLKHLTKTVFFITIGVTSAMGQHLLSRNLLHDDFSATIIAVGWSACLIVIYSWFSAEREFNHNRLKTELEHRNLLAGDASTKIPAIKNKKPKISKIEIQHTMDTTGMASEKIPDWLKKDTKS